MCAFQIGGFKNSSDAKKAAIEAARKAASSASPEEGKLIRYIPPSECADRIRIVFDDSGSMGGQIANAKQGVNEFLRNCIPNTTSVAVHFMNTKSWNTELRSNLPELATDITEAQLSSGGTPMFNTMKQAFEATPRLTRMVVFTDGSPTDRLNAEGNAEMQGFWGSSGTGHSWIDSANVIIQIDKSMSGDAEKLIPIDTVFFGTLEYSQEEIRLLKYLAEKTGGFFLHFDPAKPNIWKQLKYLAPVNRLALTDGSFRAAVEKGEK